MVVVLTIPFAATEAWVRTVSCGFHPLRALSAERVSHGTIACAAAWPGASSAATRMAAGAIALELVRVRLLPTMTPPIPRNIPGVQETVQARILPATGRHA